LANQHYALCELCELGHTWRSGIWYRCREGRAWAEVSRPAFADLVEPNSAAARSAAFQEKRGSAPEHMPCRSIDCVVAAPSQQRLPPPSTATQRPPINEGGTLTSSSSDSFDSAANAVWGLANRRNDGEPVPFMQIVGDDA
jgi:hypothetical protein